MASVNKVILIGNVGKDPEVRYAPSGDAIANITLATTDQWRDRSSGEKREATEWHRVTFFGKLAEIVGQYVKKGSSLYVEGSLRTRKWQDKDGQDRYTTEIRADEMKMLGSRNGGRNDDAGGGNDQHQGGDYGGGYGDDGGQYGGGQPQGGQNRNGGNQPNNNPQGNRNAGNGGSGRPQNNNGQAPRGGGNGGGYQGNGRGNGNGGGNGNYGPGNGGGGHPPNNAPRGGFGGNPDFPEDDIPFDLRGAQ